MPRQRNFDSLYKSLNIHREKETPRIPEEELPSNNCPIADHSICDELFDYEEGIGRLMYKGKVYRLSDDNLKKFRECLIKDLEGEI